MSTPGPLRAVLSAFESGAGSLTEVARRTGLTREVVDLAVERLVAMGRLEAEQLTSGCPSSGCGGCPSGTADGGPGCGSGVAASGRRGPVPVVLRLRR